MDIQGRSVHIVVDDREQASGVPDALAAHPDVSVDVTRLRFGDYHIERRVVVERKTAVDFAASLIDGRLFRQAAALAARLDRAVLLLQGTEADWQGTGVWREARQGALITVGVFYGLGILWSEDAEESARLLVYLGRQVQQSIHRGLPRPGYRPKGRYARQFFLLQGLPGVGPERAARLLERFGSVRAVMMAATEELVLVNGIGGKTAAAMRSILDGPAMGAGPDRSPAIRPDESRALS
jgi:DNA excision repair protein ERCC-4